MKRLLIVDDALIMRMKIREIALRAGWSVVAEATNGAEAVRLYDEHQPDMVTLDMVMPEMDGLSALKAIRQNHPHEFRAFRHLNPREFFHRVGVGPVVR